MKQLEQLTLTELKVHRDLLENRIGELRRHQIDDEFFPPYTNKEIIEINDFEKQAIKALSAVNKMIRLRLDEFIKTLQ